MFFHYETRKISPLCKTSTFFEDLSILKDKEYLTSLNFQSYCDINVCLYSAATTCLCEIDQLKEIKPVKSKPKLPRWLMQLEESVTYLGKSIGQLTVIIKCKQTNKYSKTPKVAK